MEATSKKQAMQNTPWFRCVYFIYCWMVCVFFIFFKLGIWWRTD